ncbi:MAG: glycosyl hydrolase 53 family protein, partial [Gemmatimonadaceae bacterium]|nr:glycosyl hydrolase 53 family protein [Gemmatimonadaceae bacterium]
MPGRITSLLAALIVSALVGCGDTARPITGTPPVPPRRVLPVVGSDISALPRLEAAGAVYRDAADRRDALVALRAAGHTTFRLRLFVQPRGDDVVVNDLPYTLALAERAAATG